LKAGALLDLDFEWMTAELVGFAEINRETGHTHKHATRTRTPPHTTRHDRNNTTNDHTKNHPSHFTTIEGGVVMV